MSKLSEGIEPMEELESEGYHCPVPMPDHHENQWRYLPQFCEDHFAELKDLGDVIGFLKCANLKRTPCDVKDCDLPATRKEESMTRERFARMRG